MLAALLAATLVFSEADAARAYATAEGLVAGHTPRDTGTAEGFAAATYLMDRASAAGGDVRRDRFTAATPRGTKGFTNLECAVVASDERPWVVYLSHYDTKAGVDCPGANDGASTSGLLVALTGVLARHRRDLPFNGLLVWTDGEECFGRYAPNDGFWGARRAAAEARRGDEPERVDVARGRHLAARELLRRRVARRADADGPPVDDRQGRRGGRSGGFGAFGRRPSLHQPEVDQHRRAVGAEEDVGGLDVAVHDAAGVEVGETAAEREDEARDVAVATRQLALFQLLHRHPRAAVGRLARVEEPGQRRMVRPAQDLDLPPEPLRRRRIGAVEDAERGGRRPVRVVDFAASAAPQRPSDTPRADPRAGREKPRAAFVPVGRRAASGGEPVVEESGRGWRHGGSIGRNGNLPETGVRRETKKDFSAPRKICRKPAGKEKRPPFRGPETT